MRLLLALTYIAFGIWAYLQLGGDNLHPYVGMAVAFGLLFSSVIVCNEGFIRKLRGITYEQHIKELLTNKKAVKEEYQVENSIVFEDLGTGCTAYLLEIGKNSIICLYGQDYGFEPIDDEPELNQKRLFPTEKFSLIRELKNQRVLEVTPSGKVVQPTIVDKPNIQKLLDLGFKLQDGEIVEHITLAQIINTLKFST